MAKEVVSLSIDRELLDQIAESIAHMKRNGVDEMDFSKWMRDAVRRKLRQRRVAEDAPAYQRQESKKK